MLNKILKIMTVLALTVGGSALAMQQRQQPKAAPKPKMVCRGGVCRLVQPAAKPAAAAAQVAPAVAARPAIAPVATAPVAAIRSTPVVARPAVSPASQGKITVGLTPAQTAAQKAEFAKMIEAKKAGVVPAGTRTVAPTAASTTRLDTSSIKPIPVPK